MLQSKLRIYLSNPQRVAMLINILLFIMAIGNWWGGGALPTDCPPGGGSGGCSGG